MRCIGHAARTGNFVHTLTRRQKYVCEHTMVKLVCEAVNRTQFVDCRTTSSYPPISTSWKYRCTDRNITSIILYIVRWVRSRSVGPQASCWPKWHASSQNIIPYLKDTISLRPFALRRCIAPFVSLYTTKSHALTVTKLATPEKLLLPHRKNSFLRFNDVLWWHSHGCSVC